MTCWRGRVAGMVLGTALVTSCREADSVLIIQVEGPGALEGVAQLRTTLSNAGMSALNLFPAHAGGAPLALPTELSLTIARARTGQVDVAVDGLDAGGNAIAAGAGSATVTPGQTTHLTITLAPGAATCGNGRTDLGEECDDGNRVSEGTCDFRCRLPAPDGGGADASGAGTGGAVAATGGAGGRSAAGGAGGAAGQGGTGGCTVALLANGNFDQGQTGWTSTSSGRLLIYNEASVDPSLVPAPRSRPDVAWLGFDVRSETVLLRQDLAIPANALSLTVSGYFIINTGETGCQCDLAAVDIVGGFSYHVRDWSNEDSNQTWTLFTTTFDVTPAAGTTVTFQLSAVMDDGVDTSFFFDDLAVNANLCP